MVELLVAHGFDPKSIDMCEVFASWDPAIMEYFIERDADIETDNPFAYALCNRVRTALQIFKKYRDRFPRIQEQANIALRYHCKEGNQKWVSLLLWAGADPYKRGNDSYEHELNSEYEGCSALGFAALYNHYEVFELRQVRLNPMHPELSRIAYYLCEDKGIDILKRLLAKGLNPNDQENGGCSAIQRCLTGMSWYLRVHAWEQDDRKRIDSAAAREKMKAIHVLAKAGGRWIPQDCREIQDVRRSLLKMTADYTVEFVWIMSKYQACSREAIQDLLGTPSIKAHIAGNRDRLTEILSSWGGDV
ncbi:MAG: hypothetical protein IT427_16635 [Pirellulales bacterium]|nr:hypothetical protein [Pirellulales bacterium]